MKSFKIFCNQNEQSWDVKLRLKGLLASSGFIEAGSAEMPDVCIAIGGDGAFLRMIHECAFCNKTRFVGVNTGTLGFLQEVKANELQAFVDALSNNNFTEQRFSYIQCEVDGERINCLNEIVMRDKDLRILSAKIIVDGTLLESFAGDGLLICTSVGSTAHNLCLGGSIAPYEFDTLQLTPIAPLNSAAYRSLTNSIIMPGDAKIEILPQKRGQSLFISADGINKNFDNVKSVKITLVKSAINYVRLSGHSFWEKINEKLLAK